MGNAVKLPEKFLYMQKRDQKLTKGDGFSQLNLPVTATEPHGWRSGWPYNRAFFLPQIQKKDTQMKVSGRELS